MTPWDRLLALDWESLQSACAGDLSMVFEETGLTHVLVIEAHKNSTSTVRALASRARLMRQLKDRRRNG
jgi:hypothetical protein